MTYATTIERQAASRYWVQRRELPGCRPTAQPGGWYWLVLDTRTGDYVDGLAFETREEALAVALEVLA